MIMIVVIRSSDDNAVGERGLEYGVRAPNFLRKSTGENENEDFPRRPTGSLFGSYGSLRKSPETSGSAGRMETENVI